MSASRFAVFDHAGPIAMAHRGFSPGGAGHHIENSLAAFHAAVDLGVVYLETDVHATADGKLLAFHDDRLDRVTDATGVVSELSWTEVSRARIGGLEPIPLLEDVLGSLPQARLNIDVKAAAAIGPLVEVLRRTDSVDRVCVASFSERRVGAVRKAIGPRLATSVGPARTAAWRLGGALPSGLGAVAVRAALRGVAAVQVPPVAGPLSVVTPGSLARAHALGVQVHVWTVDEPAQMHRLLDLGVDAIITDRADTLRDVLIERGQWEA